MAMLLMRSPELADAEKLAEHAWPHNEKALVQEVQQKASGEGRSRARKGKTGQKKQPQRGLGVAQLEKLRLQEQSKQEAACLASLQTLPSLGFTDQNQNGGIYFRHIKGAISHHLTHGRGNALAFGNGRFGPPDKMAEYLARDGHRHVGKGTMDGDVFRTFMSLASTDHSRSVSLSRHERGPCVSIMLPRRKDDCEMPFLCNDPQPGNDVHAYPSGINNSGTDGSPTRRAPCALACVAAPPNSSVRKPSFFSSALLSRASPVDSHPPNAEIGDEKRSSAELNNESLPNGFPPLSNKTGAMEVGMINAKLLPVFVKSGAGAPILTLTNLQCFESSSGPANVGRHPRESTNEPVVVGVTANCVPKELSSVQNFSSNSSWSALNKGQSCGWKQPWQALHGSTHKLLHSNNLDLNALTGEVDAAEKNCGSASVAPGQQSPVEAYHSEGITRTASEDCSPRPLKIRKCGTRDENQASKEIQLFTGSDHLKSGDFLTLRLSSFPGGPQHEVEVNSQEAMAPKSIKDEEICSKERFDVLQLLMCTPRQTQQSRSYSPSPSNEFINDEGPTTRARLSCSFSSLSSGILTEHCHRPTGRKMEESLDLRLKLAL